MAGTQIFQIVGFQNSGKTSLIESLIKKCDEKEWTVGTIKHHGHGGKPTRLIKSKDTEKHRLAGASITAVEGGGNLHIEVDKKAWTLEEILEIYKYFQLNIIFIEGYKKQRFPKVVLLRNVEDEVLLDVTTNIIAVISHYPMQHRLNMPLFHSDDIDQFTEWFLSMCIQR